MIERVTVKAGQSATSPQSAQDGGEELDQVAGNTEDEVGDLIQSVKEDEMMFGEQSLLADFGPMIQHICLNPKVFQVRRIIGHCQRVVKSLSEPSSPNQRRPLTEQDDVCFHEVLREQPPPAPQNARDLTKSEHS
jgi:hypothetical protein